jgi:pimeloyl-ACP methyl ester carboxylesterase
MDQSPNPQTGFADVNGTRLYYEVQGSGPNLVLLHAGVSDHRMWDAVMPALTPRYRVIRYDQRGWGQSRLPPGPFSLYEDLYGLLQHLGVDQAIVVGVSIGGSTVIDFTLAHPEMVRALVPVAAGYSGAPPPSEAEQAQFAVVDAAYEAKDVDRVLDLEMDIWLVGPGRTRDAVSPALQEQFRAIERPNLEREIVGGEGAEAKVVRLDPPAAGRLGEIRVPTLVIVGDADVPHCVINADVIAAGIPGAQKVVLPNVAHMVPQEAPGPFLDALLPFLATV